MHYDIVRRQQVVHRRRKVTRPRLSAIHTSAARYSFRYIIFNSATLTFTLNFHYSITYAINNNIVRVTRLMWRRDLVDSRISVSDKFLWGDDGAGVKNRLKYFSWRWPAGDRLFPYFFYFLFSKTTDSLTIH